MHSWSEHAFLSGKEQSKNGAIKHLTYHLVHQPSHIETGQTRFIVLHQPLTQFAHGRTVIIYMQ